jgi:hypothetical protein
MCGDTRNEWIVVVRKRPALSIFTCFFLDSRPYRHWRRNKNRFLCVSVVVGDSCTGTPGSAIVVTAVALLERADDGTPRIACASSAGSEHSANAWEMSQ